MSTYDGRTTTGQQPNSADIAEPGCAKDNKSHNAHVLPPYKLSTLYPNPGGCQVRLKRYNYPLQTIY